LSFGTADCILTCKFCQNWDISKARELDRLHRRGGRSYRRYRQGAALPWRQGDDHHNSGRGSRKPFE
jgi:pyruvate-formate lyase-activating enzyme